MWFKKNWTYVVVAVLVVVAYLKKDAILEAVERAKNGQA